MAAGSGEEGIFAIVNQDQAPLVEAIAQYLKIDHSPFYMPGHKRGQGIDPEFMAIMGRHLFYLDLPELPSLVEATREAESLAAAAYGSDRTWFLVNGATSGITAMLLAAGDRVLLGRNCHRAAIAGLVTSGAMPVYLETTYDPVWQLDQGVSPATLRNALVANPQVKAVVLVTPNYFGQCGDLEKLVAIAHEFDLPIMIDAAHGSHLRFHPDLPMDALGAGADVVVHSIHKMGSSLTQTAMLHCQGTKINADRLDQAVQMVSSTSPNIILLASLDAARRQIATDGFDLLTDTISISNWGRSQINQIPHLSCSGELPNLDPTRLTVMVNQLGYTGYAVDEILEQSHGVVAELPTLNHLVFATSIGNRQSDIQHLVSALAQIPAAPPLPLLPLPPLPVPRPQITPRSAFFSPSQAVPLTQSVGHIATELISPYPPGIPLICPGELISQEIIDCLLLIKNAGAVVTGCSDRTLATIQVVL